MAAKFVLCIDNKEYNASLEKGKVYRVKEDRRSEKKGFIRIIDESGEDYLFPEDHFVILNLPQAAIKALVA